MDGRGGGDRKQAHACVCAESRVRRKIERRRVPPAHRSVGDRRRRRCFGLAASDAISRRLSRGPSRRSERLATRRCLIDLSGALVIIQGRRVRARCVPPRVLRGGCRCDPVAPRLNSCFCSFIFLLFHWACRRLCKKRRTGCSLLRGCGRRGYISSRRHKRNEEK